MQKVRFPNKENSIQEAIFSITFANKFDKEDIQKFLILKEVLKDDFPITNNVIHTHFQVGDIIETPQSDIGGVIFCDKNEDGNSDWVIKVQEDFIAVSCLNYKGWLKTWPKALNYLETIIETVNISNTIKCIALRYINRFVSNAEGQDQYPWNDIFKPDSPYLSTNIKKNKLVWHLFQGWFENDDIINCMCLNNVNLDSILNNQELITNINLLRQAQCEDIPKTKIDAFMNQLHNEIKNILKEIVSLEMAQKIGLDN